MYCDMFITRMTQAANACLSNQSQSTFSHLILGLCYPSSISSTVMSLFVTSLIMLHPPAVSLSSWSSHSSALLVFRGESGEWYFVGEAFTSETQCPSVRGLQYVRSAKT